MPPVARWPTIVYRPICAGWPTTQQRSDRDGSVHYARRMKLVAPLAAFALVFASWAPRANAQRRRADEALERAVVLFEESERAYNAGEFAEAATLLRRAYELHPDATLLFNLARALEGMGDFDGAIENYERYLSEGQNLSDRGAIERRLVTLRAQRDRLRGDREAEPERETERERDPIPREEPAREQRSIAVEPWVVFGAGILIVGGGFAFGGVSAALASDAEQEPVMVTAVDLHSQAEVYAIVANVFFLTGALTAAAGLVWGLVDVANGGSVQAMIVPGGAIVRGRF
jgi:tetratricopeptide (TPR) repeat protein